MTLIAFAPSTHLRKCADPLADCEMCGHDVAMNTIKVHIDRSLRVAVSDESGKNLAALRLSRAGAEGLADALLEFAGNSSRCASPRSGVVIDASPVSRRKAAATT